MSFSATWRLRLAKFQLWLKEPEVKRAFRATAAYMTPVLLIQYFWTEHVLDASFAALCAHNISLTDMRGPYKQRFLILLAMSIVLSCAAGLGVLAAHSVLASVLGMGIIAALACCWRHLSPEYGPGLATGSMMVFLIALSVRYVSGTPDSDGELFFRMTYALGGALVGTLYQVLLWPINPQHPLRQAVADGWNQLAILCETMRPQKESTPSAPVPPGIPQSVAEAESELSQTLDKSVIALDAEGSKRQDFLKKLDAVNLGTARLATRIVAFYSALEPVLKSPDAGRLISPIESLLVALANLSRSISTTVVSRKEEHFGLSWLRFQRVANLALVLRERLEAEKKIPNEIISKVIMMLRNIESQLPLIEKDLRKTVDGMKSARFTPHLPDVGILSLKPLAVGLNFSWPPDPTLVRYALRMAALTMIAVAVYKSYHIPYGYWIALTMMVVLQPNYGPTREKSMQRMIGTIAGGIVGSAFAWIHPELWMVHALMAVAAFCFAVNLKHHYTIAVFFVTLLVVFSTESMTAMNLSVTQSRIWCTVAGGVSALLAAFVFWPNWEKNRFPRILIKTIRANRDYLLLLASRLSSGGGFDEGIAQSKRLAEAAGSELFTSLQRVSSDPKKKQGDLTSSAALMSSALRITRALTVLSLHLRPQKPLHDPSLDDAVKEIARSLELIIQAIDHGCPEVLPNKGMVKKALGRLKPDVADSLEHKAFVHAQLESVHTEIETIWVVLRKENAVEGSTAGSPQITQPVVS
ncbi:MAG: FUSC family protein [Puniceicoccales bacterium]|jgi:uncharacterized membrane protein YccC|nr:FUSC family protein [Puniceicoccales bacterium]